MRPIEAKLDQPKDGQPLRLDLVGEWPEETAINVLTLDSISAFFAGEVTFTFSNSTARYKITGGGHDGLRLRLVEVNTVESTLNG